MIIIMYNPKTNRIAECWTNKLVTNNQYWSFESYLVTGWEAVGVL